MKKSVMIGMSGGVDSSVAAAVLLEKGYEVVGVTLKLVPDMPSCEIQREDGCCSLSAIEDARRVADMLGISYYVLNFTEIFDKEVIQYFVNEYKKGKTPNPCIACNRHVKFDHMLKKATAMGIDYIATGHYARIEYNQQTERYTLKKSVTQKKDQTYALYNLNQEQLSRTLMPIGDYTKEQVREKAEKIGLNVASKPDSQEICFVEDNNHGRFISGYTGETLIPGNFVDINGKILGRHKGIVNYTIGQRKGLGIALGKPVFVIDINPDNNTVILGDEKHIFKRELVAEDINIISGEVIEEGVRVTAKIRYSAKEAPATLSPIDSDRLKVLFDEPQRAITSGQSIVFYNGDEVIGGGIIR